MRSGLLGWNTNWLTTDTCSFRPALCGDQLWPPSGLLYTASPMVPASTFAGLWGSTPSVSTRILLRSVVILLQVVPPSRVLYRDSLVATYMMPGFRGCGAMATMVSLLPPQAEIDSTRQESMRARTTTIIVRLPVPNGGYTNSTMGGCQGEGEAHRRRRRGAAYPVNSAYPRPETGRPSRSPVIVTLPSQYVTCVLWRVISS